MSFAPKITGSQTAGVQAGSGEGWEPVECCLSILSQLLIYWFSVNHDPPHFSSYLDYCSKWGKINSKHFLRDRESFMSLHPNPTSRDFWFTQIRENKRSNKHSWQPTPAEAAQEASPPGYPSFLPVGFREAQEQQQVLGDVTAAREPHQPKQRESLQPGERGRGVDPFHPCPPGLVRWLAQKDAR